MVEAVKPRYSDAMHRRLGWQHGMGALRAALAALALVWPAMAGDAAATSGSATPVVFLPHWIPQAQFAGYYLAESKGFYRQEGLAVKVLEGGVRQPPDRALAEGKADFTSLFLSTAVVCRADGLPLVNLAQLMQRSSLLLVARKSSGIRRPEDLNGRKVSLWSGGFEVQPRALFRNRGIQPLIVPQGSTINLFLRGGVDAASAMWYNEYHLLLAAGLEEKELTIFRYDQFDLNFPEDGIYCREDLWRQRPAVCRAFVRASLEGWRYAFAHPEEALDEVMRRAANAPTNRAHQRWMLERMRDLMDPAAGAAVFGRLRRADYDRVAGELQRAGALKTIPDWSGFHADLGSD